MKGMKSYGGHGLVASEEASIHVYPLYLYSKKKVRQCSEGFPTACGVIAKTGLVTTLIFRLLTYCKENH